MFRKKKEPLFGDHIEVRCDYCTNSKMGEDTAFCRLHLDLKEDGTCPHFVYDPLKRTPETFPPLRKHDAEEFQL